MRIIENCPFCNKKASLRHLQGKAVGYYIGCFNACCPVNPISDVFPTESAAADAWNRCGKEDESPLKSIIAIVRQSEAIQGGYESAYTKEQAKLTAYREICEVMNISGGKEE